MTSMIFFIVFVCILVALFLIINFLFAPHNPVNWFGKLIIWEKLSNSENILKIFILNCNQKVISGWINYSYKVINQKIIARKMDNCGFKSVIFNKNSFAVKKQRVYGSYHWINPVELRFTPVNFEINYKVKILFKQINIVRYYSTLIKHDHLQVELIMDPWFVTGFTDGEGCFLISIIKDNKYKLGWRIICRFEIHLNIKDLHLLKKIKRFFNVGNIYFTGKDQTSIQFRVESHSGLIIIIDHFEKYPLKTKKKGDYLLFKQAFELVRCKEHLTKEGLKKLIFIKAALNKGLSNDLEKAFQKININVIPVSIPEVKLAQIINSNWLVGFVEAEGCFNVQIFKSTTKTGEAVKLSFIITQHIRDEKLMISLIELLKCGKIFKNRETFDFKVSKLSDILNKIIPFFKKYPILGMKALDFDDWCKVAELMKNKIHLTAEGLEEIRKIKAGMNRGRNFS